jgi:hypothetical protein
MYIIHVKVLYNIIDFAQKTGQGRQARENVNLIILLKNLVYKQLGKQDTKKLTVNKLAIQQFIQTHNC